MQKIIIILLSTILVSLISFIGIIFLSLKESKLNKILLYLVALSAGTLIGGAFLHLIPEAAENSKNAFIWIILGFILFFIIEKFLHWQHCHEENCKIHTFAYMNLIGDFFHNFLDGIIIAGAFITDIKLGLITTFAIAIHEIPQEIGDLGVLIYGGFSKKKAILMNFIFALTAVAGGIFGYFLSEYSQIPVSFFVPIAAGGFIYIAASDLIPELKKDNTKSSILHIATFLAGIAIMYFLKFLGVD